MNRVLAVVALAAIALVGCGDSDDVTATTEGVMTSSSVVQETTSTTGSVRSYRTPRDVIEAAEASGLRCESASSVFDSLDEPDGQAGCDLAGFETLYSVITFTSELQRTRAAIGAIVVACGATEQASEPMVYVYGDHWMIVGFNEHAGSAQGFGDVNDLATAIGGSVQEVDCIEVTESVLNIDASRDWQDVVSDLTVEELRGLLGEGAAS